MPTYAGGCGHSFTNRLEITGVDTFDLSPEDVRVIRGTEGAKSLNIKLGRFVDTLQTIRVEYEVSLFHVTRAVYQALIAFAENDIRQFYLNTFQGSITMDYSGERFENCVIKKIDLPEISAYVPADGSTPETEYIEEVRLRILAPSYRLI